MDKPDFYTEDHAEFLTELRDSGETNMFGATPYLQFEFELTRREAGQILAYWMSTFTEE